VYLVSFDSYSVTASLYLVTVRPGPWRSKRTYMHAERDCTISQRDVDEWQKNDTGRRHSEGERGERRRQSVLEWARIGNVLRVALEDRLQGVPDLDTPNMIRHYHIRTYNPRFYSPRPRPRHTHVHTPNNLIHIRTNVMSGVHHTRADNVSAVRIETNKPPSTAGTGRIRRHSGEADKSQVSDGQDTSSTAWRNSG